MTHTATGPDQDAVIVTYGWDRLLSDPIPGPRGARDFTGLHRLTRHNFAITPASQPVPPTGSALPRLAGALEATLVLLDPADGAEGIRQQLHELVDAYEPERLEVIDVGGDALARGDEATLRSPLADALVLAACTEISVPVNLLVAGPGLDAEVAETDVLSRCQTTAATLTSDHVAAVANVFDWHPSEASALLAAAARGVRGTVEVRGSGLTVQLTEHSPTVYRADYATVAEASLLVPRLRTAGSLDEAEATTRAVCGFTEIDQERRKAEDLARQGRRPVPPTPELDRRVFAFEDGARSRGADYVTFRRLAEALGLTHSESEQVRNHLLAKRPQQHVPPLWSLHPETTRTDSSQHS